MDAPLELPTEGGKLQHYTRARPRPRRTHRQPPTRCQVQTTTCDNDASGTGTPLDEGLEEFFSFRLAQEPLLNVSLDVSSDSDALSSSGSRTFKKKIGHFFAFKKSKSTKGDTPEKDQDKNTLLMKCRKSALADILRAPSKVSGISRQPCKEEDASTEEPKPLTEQCRTPDPTKRIHPRYSREGKSQSLILLSGEDEEALGINKQDKKRHSEKGDGEIYHTFEQRVHVMLHRIGVTRVLSSETKKKQAKDGEIKKAGSEGDIVDNSAELPPPSLKPRTHSMSTESSSRPATSDRAEGAGLTAAEKQSAMKERLPWKDLSRQLNEELQGRCAELHSSPRRSLVILEGTARLMEGIQRKPEDSWSLPGMDRNSPIPSPRRNGNTESSEAQNPVVAIPRSNDDNQLKLRPRLKQFQDRRAFSVHEEQLRDHSCMLELDNVKTPLFRLRRSPVINQHDAPKPCTTAAPVCTSGCIVKVHSEPEDPPTGNKGKPIDEHHSPSPTEVDDHGANAVESVQNPSIDQRTESSASH
ncbi:capping protein, Arp2/3 and myosin-I linker protein 2-like [Ambystoma mexicanum]|uniref:capping protein, Arp2/3 and myosin-I linker protein 2-like n=1 Tax=Ambystoma mexicanum TaxID=8296 RepID=UPI0037E776A4